MSFSKKTQLFTLKIIPDNGYDLKSSNVNLRFIKTAFGFLITLFLVCLFFITGYHIKLSQEKDYMHAFSIMQGYMNFINKFENSLDSLTGRISRIQRNDKALRYYGNMSIPDDGMYKAGIGGHEIVDNSVFNIFHDNIIEKLSTISLKIKLLDRQIFVQINSLGNVETELQKQLYILNNTPSVLPINSPVISISSGFGMRRNPITGRRQFHDAVDFSGKTGEKVYATADGIITKATYHNIRGNYVIIKHGYGYETLYAHLKNVMVKVGQKVKKYDSIGEMGKTGRTTGSNLHYAVSLNNRKVNPVDYF